MEQLFQQLRQVVSYRIEKETNRTQIRNQIKIEPFHPPEPDPGKSIDPLTQFFSSQDFDQSEVVLIMLALVPHVSPDFFGSIMADLFPNGGEFAEFGGIKTKNHRGIIPTGETALYVLAGNNVDERMRAKKYFNVESRLVADGIISLGVVPPEEPRMSGALILDEEYVELLTTGGAIKPTFGPNFPAEEINTELNWEDLILENKTLEEIKEIETWLLHNDTLLNEWGMKGIIKPGYRVMFYGAPGTGKTLTAMLMGKYTKRAVYRIDLSMVVSKYIGETEKNLGVLFNKAANKDWILFFDEADAIFGKRTSVKDAHDKYANQEVSYLLQRIEAHPGLVILASNLKNNIDAAFTRRFQSIIEFKTPNYDERLKLWQNNLPKGIQLENKVSLEDISQRYEITGANIVNVVQHACLQKLKKSESAILLDDIVQGIKKEYVKEGKMI